MYVDIYVYMREREKRTCHGIITELYIRIQAHTKK